MPVPRLYVIAAACKNMGIGKDNTLPWRLPKEMKNFATLTKATEEGKKNAVIMGRKTWEHIPEKFRPLPGRLNIIMTNNQSYKVESPDCYVVHSLDEAVKLCSETLQATVDKMWVIGGAFIYKLALESEFCHRIYLTRIDAEYDCDVFFPDFNQSLYTKICDPDVSSDPQEEKGITYKFEVYEKIQ